MVYPPGLTDVFSPYLEIKSIFNGIKNRKTYATMKERIFLDFRINGILGRNN
ncbi:MAG: hypothetical protein NC915_05175 [Candidatus Omnitrophica bacterium]|nr:hypothetical protein [Candidatus Omnitrophota bacterium]